MRTDLRRWTEGEDLQIAALRSQGQNMREIATTLGRPYLSVRSRVHELMKIGKFQPLTMAEREARVVKSRERRSAKLEYRASSFMASLPNTKDMGYVIGVLYGDGFVNFKDIALGIPKSIGLSTTNESFRNAFADALETWRGAGSVKRATHLVKEVVAPGGKIYADVLYYDAWLHDRYLITELLRITGPTQTDTWSIDVNDVMRRGPAFCDGIIQGLFDSDGSFSSKGQGSSGISMQFGTVSVEGNKSLCELMEFRGYEVSVGQSKEQEDRKTFYRLSISTSDSWLQFANNINSRIDYKAKALSDFVRRRSHRP